MNVSGSPLVFDLPFRLCICTSSFVGALTKSFLTHFDPNFIHGLLLPNSKTIKYTRF